MQDADTFVHLLYPHFIHFQLSLEPTFGVMTDVHRTAFERKDTIPKLVFPSQLSSPVFYIVLFTFSLIFLFVFRI